MANLLYKTKHMVPRHARDPSRSEGAGGPSQRKFERSIGGFHDGDFQIIIALDGLGRCIYKCPRATGRPHHTTVCGGIAGGGKFQSHIGKERSLIGAATALLN